MPPFIPTDVCHHVYRLEALKVWNIVQGVSLLIMLPQSIVVELDLLAEYFTGPKDHSGFVYLRFRDMVFQLKWNDERLGGAHTCDDLWTHALLRY